VPRFTYRATDAKGHEAAGEVEAPTSEQAVQGLTEQGYQVSWLEAAERAPGPAARGMTAPEQVAFFNSQLAAMLKAGIPVSRSIRALAADMRRGRLRRALQHVAADLDDGRSLGEAFAAQRHLFPPVYGRLMEAGARSGNLPAVLLMMSTYSRAVAELRATVLSALWYPAVVLLFCVGVFTFVSLFVAPNLAEAFREFEVPLPFITAAMLFLARYIGYVLLILVGLVALVWVVCRTVRHSEGGAAALDGLKLRLPLIGSMLRASLYARLSRTLSLLLGGGVPMTESLRLARDAVGNAQFERTLDTVARLVADGQPLGASLRLLPGAPHLLAWSAHLGEERGDLVETLAQTAETYDVEAQHRAAVLKTAILPGLVFFVTIFVALTVIALLFPLVRLISSLGGGMSGM